MQKHVYVIFGPGMNLAARLEAFSEPMRITLRRHTSLGFGPKRLCSLDASDDYKIGAARP